MDHARQVWATPEGIGPGLTHTHNMYIWYEEKNEYILKGSFYSCDPPKALKMAGFPMTVNYFQHLGYQ